mmetsp:Transcript_77228/g.133636  ORF Transcript_77228/g.133636 Transcript_77228/m.133636 type:complete len:448 (-) Transcript_77228:255-1598(-)
MPISRLKAQVPFTIATSFRTDYTNRMTFTARLDELVAHGLTVLSSLFEWVFGSMPLSMFRGINAKNLSYGSAKEGLEQLLRSPMNSTNLELGLPASPQLDAAVKEGLELPFDRPMNSTDPEVEVPTLSEVDAAARWSDLKEQLKHPAPAPVESEPEMRRLSRGEIIKTIVDLVPESASWIAPRSGGTPALEFLVKSYSTGFPALPPAASEHCAKGVRLIVGALADPQSARLKPERAKVLAQTLAEAYTGCQAVQARTVDMLQGEVRGLTSQSLPAQLRVLVEEFRGAALDRMVCHFHPGAPTAGDGTPHLQLPHLANKYCRHLGSSLGFLGSRMEAAKSDRNAAGPLPSSKEAATELFWKEFDAEELCEAIVADVNQASEEAERRIDRRLLLDWAGSHPHLGYRVFYDEALLSHYGDMRPSAEQEAMMQPFIHKDFACDLLLSALEA